MWILDLFKSFFAAIAARRAAKAAAELPQGTAAIGSIDADGSTIEAQLRSAKVASR